MSQPRRALQPLVAGAALAVLLLFGGCADTDQVRTGIESQVVAPAATAVATTAPAVVVNETPPSAVALPTLAPRPTATAQLDAPTATSAAAPPLVPTATAPAEIAPTAPAESDQSARAAVTTVAATPVAVTETQQVLAANGAEVYTLNCARCHGENGMGSAQYSAGLVAVGSRYSTDAMIAELTTGHPVTFGFADRLTADEIASVVAYVKSVFP